MASLNNVFRLPSSSIHLSPHSTTFGKSYFPDSSPNTVNLRPLPTSHRIGSSLTTTPRASARCSPITCVIPHHRSSQTLETLPFSPLPQSVKVSTSFGSSKKGLLHSPSKTICFSSSSSPLYQNCQTAIPAIERLMSVVVYCLPFLNGLNYGTFLFDKYPILELAFDPIVPLLSFYRSIPAASMVGFFTLYLGVVRDKKFSRYVRFNSLQAMMLDVLLVLPSLTRILLDAQEGFKFQLLEMSYSVTFLVIVGCFLYALVFSVLGRTPNFPLVTDSVDWQIFAVDRQL